MMGEEHEKGWGRQRTRSRPPQQQPRHWKKRSLWEGTPLSFTLQIANLPSNQMKSRP